MNHNKKVKRMAGLGILTALTVVLTLLSNVIQIGELSINLSLIPIVLAAIIYGPMAGAFIGAVNGCLVLLSAGPFLAVNPVATVFVCLAKTSLAGIVAGYLYRVLKKLSFPVAIVVASIITPIINTFIFCISLWLFFDSGFATAMSAFVTINFLLEVGVNTILSPTLVYVVRALDKRYHFETELNEH